MLENIPAGVTTVLVIALYVLLVAWVGLRIIYGAAIRKRRRIASRLRFLAAQIVERARVGRTELGESRFAYVDSRQGDNSLAMVAASAMAGDRFTRCYAISTLSWLDVQHGIVPQEMLEEVGLKAIGDADKFVRHAGSVAFYLSLGNPTERAIPSLQDASRTLAREGAGVIARMTLERVSRG